MSPEARQLAEVLAELRELRREHGELRREVADLRLGGARGDRSLSLREVARRLGCDRPTTLERLLATGLLHAVPGPSGKGRRVAESEVDRAIREGVVAKLAPAVAAQAPRARTRRGAGPARPPVAREVAAAEAKAARAIDVSKLYEE